MPVHHFVATSPCAHRNVCCTSSLMPRLHAGLSLSASQGQILKHRTCMVIRANLTIMAPSVWLAQRGLYIVTCWCVQKHTSGVFFAAVNLFIGTSPMSVSPAMFRARRANSRHHQQANLADASCSASASVILPKRLKYGIARPLRRLKP